APQAGQTAPGSAPVAASSAGSQGSATAAEPALPTVQEEPEAFYQGKIVQADGGGILLAGDAAQPAGELVYVALQDAAVTGLDGNSADADALREGMSVEVGYNGMVME